MTGKAKPTPPTKELSGNTKTEATSSTAPTSNVATASGNNTSSSAEISSTKVSCPIKCPTDFVITTPCKILKASGASIVITASDLPGFPSGTYNWTTSSTNITLSNATNSASVTVQPLATPSASKDAETITVTRTADGCAPVAKTVNVTVAKVTFSKAGTQRYGHDDFDTPADSADDHISIKQLDYSFVHVVIEGGLVGTDFNFVCDDTSICTPVAPGGSAAFDLRLNAGDKTKADTLLQAKCKCAAATSFASIALHVYKEKVVDVVVAKVDNPGGSNLLFPTADYAGHSSATNDKLKDAVVKYNITNHQADNSVTGVALASGNGVVTFDIGSGGGADLTAISTAMSGTGTKVRVAIVKSMRSCYYLSAAAAVGDTSITVTTGSTFYTAGYTVGLGLGASREMVTIQSTSGNTVTFTAPLTKAHVVNESIEFPAGGWSCDPILIQEGSAGLDVVKWTIVHEVGHRSLALCDVVDTNVVMHWSQSWTDYRLRYCPRTKKYSAGTENQWETVPRT